MKTLNSKRKWFTAGLAIAGLLISANALADELTLNWSLIQLKAAAGVPNGTEHQYELTGIIGFDNCPFCTINYNGWVTVSGKWDGHSQDATETIKIEGDIFIGYLFKG